MSVVFYVFYSLPKIWAFSNNLPKNALHLFVCQDITKYSFLIIENGKKWRKLLIDILLDKLLEMG